MKTRFSCLLVVLVVLAFGTFANAQTPVYSCSNFVCTITQTLYYTGSVNGNTFGNQSFPNDGVGTTTQVYTAPNGGVGSGSGLGGSSLVAANWEASYTFATYNSLNTGFGLVSAVVSVVDSTTGSITMSQNSGAGSWYGYKAATLAEFSNNVNPTAGNSFIIDSNTDAYSGINSNNGMDTAAAGNAPAFCQQDSNQINGSFDKTGDQCIYLENADTPVTVSGYSNDTRSSTSGGANLPTNMFTSGSQATLYELVTSGGGANGSVQTSNESGAAGTEITLTYTYDLPIPQTGTPEPATLLLLGSGLSFVASKLRRKNAAK